MFKNLILQRKLSLPRTNKKLTWNYDVYQNINKFYSNKFKDFAVVSDCMSDLELTDGVVEWNNDNVFKKNWNNNDIFGFLQKPVIIKVGIPSHIFIIYIPAQYTTIENLNVANIYLFDPSGGNVCEDDYYDFYCKPVWKKIMKKLKTGLNIDYSNTNLQEKTETYCPYCQTIIWYWLDLVVFAGMLPKNATDLLKDQWKNQSNIYMNNIRRYFEQAQNYNGNGNNRNIIINE